MDAAAVDIEVASGKPADIDGDGADGADAKNNQGIVGDAARIGEAKPDPVKVRVSMPVRPPQPGVADKQGGHVGRGEMDGRRAGGVDGQVFCKADGLTGKGLGTDGDL